MDALPDDLKLNVLQPGDEVYFSFSPPALEDRPAERKFFTVRNVEVDEGESYYTLVAGSSPVYDVAQICDLELPADLGQLLHNPLVRFSHTLIETIFYASLDDRTVSICDPVSGLEFSVGCEFKLQKAGRAPLVALVQADVARAIPSLPVVEPPVQAPLISPPKPAHHSALQQDSSVTTNSLTGKSWWRRWLGL